LESLSTSKPNELARVLGMRDLVAIVIGTVIGSAIFILPADVLRELGGHTGVAMSVWIAGGVLSLVGALTFGELGAMMPEAGGLYVYLRDAFGPLLAFLYGWTQFFVIASGSVATLAVASRDYLDALVPLTPALRSFVPVTVIVIFTAINVWGTRKSAGLQTWATATKVGSVLAISIALMLARHAVPVAARLAPAPAPVNGLALIGGAGLAVVATLWAYEGWQYVTFSAGEARNPQRTFPVSIIAGTAGVVVLYLLANVAYLAALGPAAVAHSHRVAADAMTAAFGPTIGGLTVIVVEISVCSALNSVVLTAPRVFYAMARDGVFFRRLADIHPRFGTPAFAIIASSVWAMLLTVTGTYVQLLTYVIGTGWAFYGLAAVTIFWYRRNRPDAVRPFRVPGYPVTPFLFGLAALGAVVDVIVTQPAVAAKGLGIAAFGVPFYYLWRFLGQRRRDDTIIDPERVAPATDANR
jgi:APA family basic amino acid/polyamine antiporter